ncbi:hypothetical protein BYT27DRAFT_7245392 [Phlegmacium glaucopus]|nr:hypothetical protein BYT27DRAFT_7245392 [Phlegmacium glaucopus]
MDEAFKLRQKYTRFRILVIGRANTGKTTLLKRVCNTTKEPCIYDEEGGGLLEPTSERGCHDINRSFAFSSNPQFIFHDSPGFESGDESQLKEVQSKYSRSLRSMRGPLKWKTSFMPFDKSRPLLELEQRFFNEQRAGNAPVIAIFTKFDDLIIQACREVVGRAEAVKLLEDRFRAPLFKDKYPPKASVCMEGMFPILQAMHKDDSDHQKQVKELTEKTADSLDDLALKILFVSIQQNNLELCITFAIINANASAPDLGSFIKLVCLIAIPEQPVTLN